MWKNSYSVVISAPSGAGKTTLIRKLLSADDRFEFSISTTTRGKRATENDGDNYHFVTETCFQEMIARDEFVEWARVHQNYYGTTKKEVDRIQHLGKIPIFDLDVSGARQITGKLDDCVTIFIIPPSLEVLKERLRKRKSESEEQMAIRLSNAMKDLREFEGYDYIIVNDGIERALADLESIINAELCRSSRTRYKIKEILEASSDITFK